MKATDTALETLPQVTTEEAPRPDPSASLSFPPLLNIYFSWMQAKHFFVCGAFKQEQLYCVEIHTGFSRKGMLGSRPGYHFHSGPSLDDPVIAAVGYESMYASDISQFNSDSVVVLPPYDPFNPKSTLQTVEKMVARTTAGPQEQCRVVFAFSIEVGAKMVRERFEWRQIRKGDDSRAEVGGFQLVRLGRAGLRRDSHGSRANGETDAKEDNPRKTTRTESEEDQTEVVAILAWVKSWLGMANVLSTHPCSLRFVGSGEEGGLGERWALMTVVTALRIDNLHKIGRTSPKSVRIGEKIRREARAGPRETGKI